MRPNNGGWTGLPHVEYELAAEYAGQQYIRPGAVCENMAHKPVVLVLGNQLLLAVDPQYPRAQRFKVRHHTVEAVTEIVAQLAPPPDQWMQNVPAGAESALDVFAGFVMLDAWIANQDRHHEDSEREDRLTSKNRNRSIAAFVERGRSAFYASPADTRPLELHEAFRAFAQRTVGAAGAWLHRLQTVKREEISAILEKVPANRMSETCKRFTVELLLANQRRLLT